LPIGRDYHTPSADQPSAPTAQQAVSGDSSARNILNILQQQKEAASKGTSQAGNTPSSSQQGECVFSLGESGWQCYFSRNIQICVSNYLTYHILL